MKPFEELFVELRALRLKSGLTQDQVAAAIGLKCPDRKSRIYQLEHGLIANPSLKFVLDYLRACRASPDDLKGIFARYLAEPLPVSEKKARGPRLGKGDRQREKLRQDAAMVKWLQQLEFVIHNELNRLQIAPFSSLRKNAVRCSRRLFSILVKEERAESKGNEKRLENFEKRQKERGLPEKLIEHLKGIVAKVFISLQQSGELDRLPTIDEAERIMARKPSKRIVTDEWLCRYEAQQRRLKELEEFQRKSAPIIADALKLLRENGVSNSEIVNYRGFINSFLNLARLYLPDSKERQERLEYNLKTCIRPKHNPLLLRQLARFIFEQWDSAR